jgi:hypothetical protein
MEKALKKQVDALHDAAASKEGLGSLAPATREAATTAVGASYKALQEFLVKQGDWEQGSKYCGGLKRCLRFGPPHGDEEFGWVALKNEAAWIKAAGADSAPPPPAERLDTAADDDSAAAAAAGGAGGAGGGIVYEDYLTKRGMRGLHNWKDRYFVLRAAAGDAPAILTYYESKPVAGGNSRARGAVRINPGCRVTVGNGDSKFGITVDLGDGTSLRTKARDLDLANKWAAAIKSVVPPAAGRS